MRRFQSLAGTTLVLALLSSSPALVGCKASCRPGAMLQNGVCVSPQTSNGQTANGEPEQAAAAGGDTPGDPKLTTGTNPTGPNQAGSGAATNSTASAQQQLPNGSSMQMTTPANTSNATPSGAAGAAAGSVPANNTNTSPNNNAGSSQSNKPQNTSTDAGAPNANMSVDPASNCTPAPEECDGRDNDCDMRIDEDVEPMKCGIDKGICKSGTLQCRNGQWDTECQGSVEPQKETCDAENLDEDCDGIPNNGCKCTDGMTMECGPGPYTCKKGTMTCTNGAWSTCQGEVKGSAEKCDGEDNDCDGVKDNGGDRLCGGSAPYCAGSSGCVACRGATDCAAGTCEMPSCSQGRCTKDFARSGTRCAASGGNVCDGSGHCIECLGAADCKSGYTCSDQKCERLAVCGDRVVDPSTEDCEPGLDPRFCKSDCHKVYKDCKNGCAPNETCFDGMFCTTTCSGSATDPCQVVRSGDGFCYNRTWCLLKCDDNVCPSGVQCKAIGTAGLKVCE